MIIKDFFTFWNGKGIDFDGYYGFQCVDLYRQYVKDVLNLPQSPGVVGAYQIWDRHDSTKFEKIKNTPEAIPQLGDIIIWKKIANHVSIFNYGDIESFVSFDQNWPIGSICHFQNHNYTNVIGWLRPKGFDFTEIEINDQTKIDLGEKLGLMEVQAIKSTILDQRKTIKGLKDDYEQLILANKKAISDIVEDWQIKLKSANDKTKKKVKDWDGWTLIFMGIKKLFNRG